jgi:hypothetical protein
MSEIGKYKTGKGIQKKFQSAKHKTQEEILQNNIKVSFYSKYLSWDSTVSIVTRLQAG